MACQLPMHMHWNNYLKIINIPIEGDDNDHENVPSRDKVAPNSSGMPLKNPSGRPTKVHNGNTFAQMNSFQRIAHRNSFQQYVKQMSALYPTDEEAMERIFGSKPKPKPIKEKFNKVVGVFKRKRQPKQKVGIKLKSH